MEDQIASCKDSAVRGMDRFLKTFSFIPDDKLTWSPSATAKTPIRIAAHTTLTAANFATMIREKKFPSGDMADFMAQAIAQEEALTCRTEMESQFRKNTEDVLAALDTLTPEDLELALETPMGWSMPMTMLVTLPGLHAMAHAAQIDFIQTCWNDQEMHF